MKKALTAALSIALLASSVPAHAGPDNGEELPSGDDLKDFVCWVWQDIWWYC